MLTQGLGCGFQNEAAFTASIQMPLDLTFHARRELPFQVPANQKDGIPTGHSYPTSSGLAWVGPFSSPQRAISPAEKLFKLEHSGLASPLCSSPRLHTQPLVIPTVAEGSLFSLLSAAYAVFACGLLTFPSFSSLWTYLPFLY
jgi:hypothetical protein